MTAPLQRPAIPRQALRRTEAGSTATDPLPAFAAYPQAVVEASLDRILGSDTFRRSQRHRHFLRHVVSAALANHQEELKEIIIGLEVFGRDIASYDPRRDPIVRVEAGRVRDKLARYYAAEGANDAFEILIPVGGYLPQLARRQTPAQPIRNLGSLAVLPFANLSSQTDDAIFCTALADQLIDTLSRVPGLRVVGRTSAAKALSRGLDLKEMGKALGVTSVIEGSVQRAGSRLRCIAQLFNVRDRSCVWSQRFECDIGPNSDLFAFQDRIGDAVMSAVVPSTGGMSNKFAPTVAQTHRVFTANPQARDLYERARYLEQHRSIESYRKAVELLERAVALDPNFASAYSHLGVSRGNLAGLAAEPTTPSFNEVTRYASRALELDPLDGEARALLANIEFRINLNWARAEPMFREALRVAPNSAFAHNTYAGGLVFNGRYVEAVQHGRIALDLDLLNIGLRANYASICSYARDFATSIAEFEAVLDIDPSHYFAGVMLGMAHIWNGDSAAAMRMFEHVTKSFPDHPTAHFCKIFVLGFDGYIEQGKERLDALITRLGNSDHHQFNRAMAEAYLGDSDAMCATLRRVAASRELLFVSLPADPSFAPYHDDPGFLAILREFGLPRLGPSPFLAAS
jgi:adenylate cyclase